MPRPRNRRPTSVEIFYSEFDERWHGFITVGTKANGRPDRRHRTAATREACADKIRELEDQVAAGTLGKPGRKPTVEEWFTAWLRDIAPHQPASKRRKPLRPSTLRSYWSECRNWIFPHLGGHRLDALDTDHLDSLYAAMYDARAKPSHVLKVHAIVRRGLSVAMQRAKVVRNVAAMIDNPGAPGRKQGALSAEQTRQVLAVIDRLPRERQLRWKVGLAIGPRQGETLAIRWRYLDLAAGVVDIAWQVQRRTWRHGCADPHACGAAPRKHRPDGLHRVAPVPCPGKGPKHDRYHRRGCPKPRGKPCPPRCAAHAAHCPQRIGGGLLFVRPKTLDDEDAQHLVSLPPTLVGELREHRREQLQQRLAAGELWEDHDLVFCGPLGRPVDPRADWEQWRDILAEAGVAGSGTHVMRHTAATYMLELGIDVAVVQEVLGHADVRSTRGYQTVSVGLTQRAAKAMDRALFRPNATDHATGRRRRRSSGSG
jgi:integrase